MDRKITRVGVASLLVIVAAFALNILFLKPASFRGTAYADPVPAAFEFTLTSSDGTPFQLSDNQGKITLLFFGYTYCPDICPTTLAELKMVMELLKSDADKVQVVFISVDPGRDTSEKVQKYAERFYPTFIGLSGTEEDLAPIWSSYGVFREVVEGTSETNYIINHTARVILIDEAGNMRLSYGFQTPPEDIAHDIKLLLK
ncbi:MAG: SCO family protein [Anaerolineales bacterium]|nr:SCO family protein [Anaerolineales bacterium]